MLAHPDEFRPFLPSINGEDAEGATTHDGIMTEKEFLRYCQNVSDTGEWGGEPEVSWPTVCLASCSFARRLRSLKLISSPDPSPV
jgi:hypothetical protein